MIRSMTGFARRESPGPWGTLICELRAVNHRYLELSLRLPEDLRSIENEARKVLGAALRRGKVDTAIYLKGSSASAPALELNKPLVEELMKRASEVGSMVGGIPGPTSPLDLLRWPGVIREAERDASPIAAAALALIEAAGYATPVH